MKKDRLTKDVKHIERQIDDLYEKIYEKRPGHWHYRDIINAFVGSLVLGLTFVFKGALIQVSLTLTNSHLFLIVLTTSLLLTFQIYFVGYSRVGTTERRKRRFGQFWAKRFFTLYLIAIIVSFALVYLFNMNALAGTIYNVLKIVIAVSMPCAIGAAVPSLLKQY